MAIDTTNKKLALMEWCQVFEPGLPISPGTLGQDDRQQLLWGYPGILWAAAVSPTKRPTGYQRRPRARRLGGWGLGSRRR